MSGMSRGETNFHICLFLFFSLLGFVPAVLAVLTWMAAFSDSHQKCPYKAGYVLAVYATYIGIGSAVISIMVTLMIFFSKWIDFNSSGFEKRMQVIFCAMWVLTLINVVPSLVMLVLQQIHCRDMTKNAEAMCWIVQSAAMLGAMIGACIRCRSTIANKGKFGFALDMVRLSIWPCLEEISSNDLFSSDSRYGCAKNIAEKMRKGSITKRHLLDYLTTMSIYSTTDPIIFFLWSQNNIVSLISSQSNPAIPTTFPQITPLTLPTCSVCTSTINRRTISIMTPCCHASMHASCTRQTWSTSDKCPACKAEYVKAACSSMLDRFSDIVGSIDNDDLASNLI